MKVLGITELAEYLGLTKRTMQRRVVKGNWCCVQRHGLGGYRKVFEFEQLPLSTRQAVVSGIISKHLKLGLDYNNPGSNFPVKSNEKEDVSYLVSDVPQSDDWLAQHKFAHELDMQELTKPYVRQGLVVMANLYNDEHEQGKIKGYDNFCLEYNARQLALHKAIYQVIYKISRASLLRWEKIKKDQQSATAPPSFMLDKELLLTMKEIMLVMPNISPECLSQYCQHMFKDHKLPTVKQLEAWMQG